MDVPDEVRRDAERTGELVRKVAVHRYSYGEIAAGDLA